jgi:hypothetical protein
VSPFCQLFQKLLLPAFPKASFASFSKSCFGEAFLKAWVQ